MASVTVLALTGMLSAAGAASAEACPSLPRGLSPSGPGARFTMLIRVNQTQNARAYASHDTATGGLADWIRPRDVFVINTRFPESSPAEWSKIARILGRSFPCNRILALNGLGADPSASGYAYALLGNPRVWGLLTDWERLDWRAARGSNPFLAPWSGRFKRASVRVRRWVGRLTSSPGAPGRVGVVPELRNKWDYGKLAREISGPHRRLAPGRRGLQSVQTQDVCAGAGGRGMKAIVGRLLQEYKASNFRRVKGSAARERVVRRHRLKWLVHVANLSVQVSFTQAPEPWEPMALLRTSPARAAKCTATALRRGAGAILYWASPDSMHALLSLPRMCALRPSPAC